MAEEKQDGIFIPADLAQSLMEDIEEMRNIYADQSRGDWFDADDIARDVAERLGSVIESQQVGGIASEKQDKGLSLADRAAAAKDLSDGLDQGGLTTPTGRDER